MIEHFREHRAEFDSLALLLREDRHVQMIVFHGQYFQYHDIAYTPDRGPILGARRKRYSDLLRKVGISRNVWNDSTSTLFMKSISKWRGEIRGYYYSEIPPGSSHVTNDDIMTDSDQAWAELRSSSVATLYRPLAPHWYLYRQRQRDID